MFIDYELPEPRMIQGYAEQLRLYGRGDTCQWLVAVRVYIHKGSHSAFRVGLGKY